MKMLSFLAQRKGCTCDCRACRDGNCWMCPDGKH